MSREFSGLTDESLLPPTRLLTDQARDEIRRDILHCVWRPGSEVTEGQLARRYGFGKGPVRAALHRLAQEGLVRAVPRRGYIVSPLTVRDVHDLFEFRLLLEPATVRLATGRLTAESRQYLEGLCRADLANGLAFNEANTEFHVSIARLGGNRHMTDALAQVLAQIERLFLLRYPSDDSQASLEEHRRLIDALEQGDDAGAVRIATTHIEVARQQVLDSILSSADVMSVSLT